MIEWLSGMPGAVERWKKQGATLYLVATTIAGWTVVASTMTGRRPSEMIAAVAGSAGFVPVQRWLTIDAPDVIAVSSTPVRGVLLDGVVLVGVVLAVRVLLLGRRHPGGIELEASIAMSSRSVATPWLLMLLAAQQEPFRFSAADVGHALGRAGTVALIALAAALVLWMLVRRIGSQALGDLFAALARGARHVVTALLVLPGGMLWTLLAPVLAMAGWAFQPEPDRLSDARRERAEHAEPPTGAIRKTSS